MENVKTETNSLSNVEKAELRDIAKAYTKEEYETIIKVIPDDYLWDELIRRNSSMIERINHIQEIIGGSFDNINLISARAWEDIRVRYDDLKDKFSKIRKEFSK